MLLINLPKSDDWCNSNYLDKISNSCAKINGGKGQIDFEVARVSFQVTNLDCLNGFNEKFGYHPAFCIIKQINTANNENDISCTCFVRE